MSLPRPLQPVLSLAQALRRQGLHVATDQVTDFISAIGLLGPRSLDDIYRAGRATLAIPHERKPEYEALFRAIFLGQNIAAGMTGEDDDEDEVTAYEPTGRTESAEADEQEDEAGARAALAERLGQRPLDPGEGDAALADLARHAPRALPRRLSRRRKAARRGDRIDLRRMLRDAPRNDGEALRLLVSRRRTRQRRIVLLIDVSGSMKERTEPLMRLAHVLVQAADHAEVFTLGTRLTRITPALAVPNRERALGRVSELVADIDGGTRIGDALLAYLAVPRFAGQARGAAVVVISDGLERGGPEAMQAAVARLSRMAWRLDWLTPLAADPGFAPRTRALGSVLPWLDTLGDGASVRAVADHLLNMARAA